MEIKKFLTVAIVASVVALIFGAILPVFADTSASEDTFKNEGPRMSPLGENTITITYSNDNWKINDRDLGFGSFPITQGTVMLFGQTGSNRAGFLYASDNGTYTRTNVVRTGEYTFEYIGETKTVNTSAIVNGNTYTSSFNYVEEIYYNDPNGGYSWFGAKPDNAYIPDNWDKFNAWSSEGDHFYAIIGDTITIDGTIVTEGVTTTMVLNDVPEHEGIKNISSYTLNIEGEDPIACRGYILPYEVVGERSVHMDGTLATLFNLLPLLIGFGLVIGVAGIVLSRRM